MLSPLFRVRRRMAKIGFWTIIAIAFICLGIVIFGNAQTAANLREAGIIIAPIIVCLTAQISHYMKLVSDADLHKA